MSLRSVPFFLVLLLLVRGPLLASPEQPTPFRVNAFSYEVPFAGLHVLRGVEHLPIDVQPFTPGRHLELPGTSRSLEFFLDAKAPREAAAAPAEGAAPGAPPHVPEWRKVATVQLPATGRDFTLVFVPQQGQAEPFRVVTIDNSADAFPAGTIRLINFSPHPVALQLGAEQSTLAPGAQMLKTPQLDDKFRSYLQVAYSVGGQWQVFHQGPLSLLPERRATVIITYSSTYLHMVGSERPRGRDGRIAPEMLTIQWVDRPRVERRG